MHSISSHAAFIDWGAVSGQFCYGLDNDQYCWILKYNTEHVQQRIPQSLSCRLGTNISAQLVNSTFSFSLQKQPSALTKSKILQLLNKNNQNL